MNRLLSLALVGATLAPHSVTYAQPSAPRKYLEWNGREYRQLWVLRGGEIAEGVKAVKRAQIGGQIFFRVTFRGVDWSVPAGWPGGNPPAITCASITSGVMAGLAFASNLTRCCPHSTRAGDQARARRASLWWRRVTLRYSRIGEVPSVRPQTTTARP